MEVIAHLFRALYELGYTICLADFVNGFNALCRQKMLDAVHKRCPQLTPLFNLFYTTASPCFLWVKDEIRVIWGMEGSRMGCVLGSLGFCISVADLYEYVLKQCEGTVAKALTDDFPAATPPGDPCAPAIFFDTLRREAKRRCGLELSAPKAIVLTKPGATPPANLDGQIQIIQGKELAQWGTRLAGRPSAPMSSSTTTCGRNWTWSVANSKPSSARDSTPGQHSS